MPPENSAQISADI